MNVLRITEMKTVKKIYGRKEIERLRIRIKKKKIENILQGEDTVACVQSIRLRWYGQAERVQSQQIATDQMEGTR